MIGGCEFMKLELTEQQYKIIRDALESYYYICKDDGEFRHLLDDITELEITLNNQVNSQ